jgi:prepilin-type N-terminal cleavage/methylation domain-containing protein
MNGFTLVEIMIVVMITGLLAAMAIPGFTRARENTQMSAAMNDLRVFAGAFEMYAMENGTWPADRLPGEFPPEMDGYLDVDTFTAPAPIGGNYDWDPPSSSSKPSGVAAGVSVRNHHLRADQVQTLRDRFGESRLRTLNSDELFYVLAVE